MPSLRLSNEEARDLKSALEVRLHSLRVELTATEHKDYRALVRAQLDRLEVITARLDAEVASGDRPAGP